ncbi:peptide chain release factor H [Massilia sp. PAMC28688]|uniref:peptide chain release factor H n=1 Tax=Massilia sp. PAMC28688 TaxID=2861283 RepID=UPI001C624FB0|nr:peptide chain release factor H [Massilia sp. PAMC28688]QYF93274.1 peptide chain release factor H [Massilia sp. PAMC28688]
MIWLQLTANTGPAECCLGVRKAFDMLCAQANQAGVAIDVIEQIDGPVAGTLRSVLLEVGGDGDLARRWCGTLLWICDSPYRSGHKRKNWFLHGAAFAPPSSPSPEVGEIRYEAIRASGPGGQHVNKTDSAIRATHVATGLSVKVQTERSQHANRRIAGQLLAGKLAALAAQSALEDRAARRSQHWSAERGNAVRTFEGMGFKERR